MSPRAMPGDTPTPWKRVSADSSVIGGRVTRMSTKEHRLSSLCAKQAFLPVSPSSRSGLKAALGAQAGMPVFRKQRKRLLVFVQARRQKFVGRFGETPLGIRRLAQPPYNGSLCCLPKTVQSSLKCPLISISTSSRARSASGPSQRICNFDPCPAASIIRPIMLLPFTSSFSFFTQTSARNRLATLTKSAAGRACKPSRFTIVISFSAFCAEAPAPVFRLSNPIGTFRLHYIEQLCVEFQRRVAAKALEFLVHRCHFNQPCQIAARPHRNGDVRHFDIQNFVKLAIQPGAIYFLGLAPILQGHHHIQPLLYPNRANAENRSYIDDPDPAHFHVIAGELRRRRHQLAAFQRSDPGHVISDQAISTLDQLQHALTFSDAAYPADENADAENIHH